mgnify:FL=1
MNQKLVLSELAGSTEPVLITETIGNHFDKTATRYPDALALVSRHQSVRWTYREMQQRVDDLACGLLALGIEPGDRVGIWSPNCYEWVLTQFATARMGAILVCINPAYRSSELEYALNRVECKALVLAAKFKSSDYHAMLTELAPEIADCQAGELQASVLPHLRIVISLAESKQGGMYRFADVCTMGSDADRSHLQQISAQLDPHDPINIQFTSGTTGNPKGATLSHYNILNNAIMCAENMELGVEDRLCIPVPLYHCFGMVLGSLVCACSGAAAIYPDEAFDPLTTLAAVEEERCTALHGVPTMFIAQLDSPGFERFDVSSLRTGVMAGSTCPVELMNRVRMQMNMGAILIGYGQTETSPINHMTLPDDPVEKRVESVGRPVPHCEIKIVDENGKVVPVGEKGEICARGYNVMLGYWNDPERTRDTIDADGWLHSGDIGVMDADGYTQVTGRIKDMIIRGGENVYPREIEEFLYGHPDILEVQVFGVPDERLGEVVCAWVQLREGNVMDEEGLRDFCRDKIAQFKIPRYVRFVEEFPMTVTGKIQKFVMRERMAEELARES